MKTLIQFLTIIFIVIFSFQANAKTFELIGGLTPSTPSVNYSEENSTPTFEVYSIIGEKQTPLPSVNSVEEESEFEVKSNKKIFLKEKIKKNIQQYPVSEKKQLKNFLKTKKVKFLLDNFFKNKKEIFNSNNSLNLVFGLTKIQNPYLSCVYIDQINFQKSLNLFTPLKNISSNIKEISNEEFIYKSFIANCSEFFSVLVETSKEDLILKNQESKEKNLELEISWEIPKVTNKIEKVEDFIVINKGETLHGEISKYFNLDISDPKVVEIANILIVLNVGNHPNLMIDNLSVIEGKVVKKPDGFRGDFIIAGTKLKIPNSMIFH